MNRSTGGTGLLDRGFAPFMRWLYDRLGIPRGLPPEVIVLAGHAAAFAAAVGLALAPRHAGWALLAALGVTAGHLADNLDGLHARQTDQVRPGGALLDHVLDPLALGYLMVGLALSCDSLPWGMAALLVINGTAVLTILRAQWTGALTTGPLGPTEVRTLLALYGIAQVWAASEALAHWTLVALTLVGGLSFLTQLVLAVRRVNRT